MRPRTLLITGASSGIGRALAIEYARGGAHVALAARRAQELESVARDVKAAGGSALCLTLDVSDPAAAREAVQRAERDLGSLEMVIANAGRGDTKHSSILSWEDVAAVVDVNLSGAIATLLAAVPIMLAQRGGHLVGVTSLAGRRGLPTSAAYSATKAALSVFLESIRIDLAPAAIRVTDVQPGFVETAMSDNMKGKAPMPFVWPVDKAARHIARRLERGPNMVAFPWQLAALTALARHLPDWLYDRVVRANVRAE